MERSSGVPEAHWRSRHWEPGERWWHRGSVAGVDEATVCAIAPVLEEVSADARAAGAEVRKVAVDGVASSALPVSADCTLVEL